MKTAKLLANIRQIVPTMRVTAMVEYAISAFIVGLLLTLVVSLPRGLDFSDTGYYYSSIFNLPQIDMQTTQYSVVWRFLAFTELFLFHRFITLALLFGTAFLFVRSAHEFIERDLPHNPKRNLHYAALATVSIIPIYTFWLPDPSYNSLGYSLLLLIYALAFRVSGKLSHSARSSRTELIIAGAISFPLFLSRLIAPAFVIASVIPLVLIVARPRLQELAKAAGWVAVGLSAYLIVQSLIIEPVWVTLERMEGGFLRREILARRDFLSHGISYLTRQSGTFLSAYPVIIAAATSLFALQLSRPALTGRTRQYSGWLSGLLLIILAIAIGLQSADYQALLFGELPRRTNFSLQSFALVTTAVGGSLIATLLALIYRSPASAWLPRVCVVLIALVLGIAAFFGTQSGWYATYFRYSGVLLAALCLVTLSTHSRQIDIRFSVALATSAVLCLLPVKNLLDIPYRLPAPLSEQTEAVPEGRGTRFMRVDAPTRELLTTFAQVRNSQPADAPRRALIDLSGRLPMVAFQLDADTPRSAWILSMYPGSQALFDYTYDSLPLQTLESAWILEAPAWDRSLAPDALNARGLDFPEAYTPVAMTWSDYLNSPLILWERQGEVATD
ncbi:hypothetical protein [Maricaulis sp.]|uniref:hypothetical protein n=1 Tax=Maricaulis sp. TaxID=1486257 RepID=UPI001B2ABF4A|nr:hypothetical protein [Maricaulis sp.]MBO6797754.1 hypothetical protein [Maricaulis sp.]